MNRVYTPKKSFTRDEFVNFVNTYADWYLRHGWMINGMKIEINQYERDSFKNKMVNGRYLLIDGIKIKVNLLDD